MKIVIVGNGKMGRAVAALAEARGHSIHAMIGAEENAGGRALTRSGSPVPTSRSSSPGPMPPWPISSA